MEVTKREVLASVGIVAVMLLIGMVISQRIWQAKLDQDEIYQKAAEIADAELFQYGMRTGLGNAFVHGELSAVDPVSFPEIGGEYMALEKVKERHTRHTRQVRHTRTNAKEKTETYYTTEEYWTWDRVSSEEKTCKEVLFCGAVFPSTKIQLPGMEYIATIRESAKIRYKYYGTGASCTGTVFTELRDGGISEDSPFYKDMDIEEARKFLESRDWRWVFWLVWAGVTGALTYGFFRLENWWME